MRAATQALALRVPCAGSPRGEAAGRKRCNDTHPTRPLAPFLAGATNKLNPVTGKWSHQTKGRHNPDIVVRLELVRGSSVLHSAEHPVVFTRNIWLPVAEARRFDFLCDVTPCFEIEDPTPANRRTIMDELLKRGIVAVNTGNFVDPCNEDIASDDAAANTAAFTTFAASGGAGGVTIKSSARDKVRIDAPVLKDSVIETELTYKSTTLRKRDADELRIVLKSLPEPTKNK